MASPLFGVTMTNEVRFVYQPSTNELGYEKKMIKYSDKTPQGYFRTQADAINAEAPKPRGRPAKAK